VWDRSVPKYDAFGREIGEDTLDGLGGTPGATPRPEPASPPREPLPRPEPAAPRAAAPGPEAPASDDAARQALAAQLRGALAQAQTARAATAPPAMAAARRPKNAARGCLVAFVMLFALIGVAVAGLVFLIGHATVKTATDEIRRAIPSPVAKPSTGPVPRGLGPRSLVRKANFAAAIRKLSSTELRLDHLRVAPERIDATLITRGGRLRSVQIQPGGALARFGPDSGPGFDQASTMPFARIRPGAPERLARRGAAKLHVAVSTLQYLVPTTIGGSLNWAAYFTHGRYVLGDSAGRWQRSYP
jgi:hypothetical protein